MPENSVLEKLPYEFARQNALVLDAERERIVLGPDASRDAMLEIQRVSGGSLALETVDHDAFDELLRNTYTNVTSSSASVMEDIQDDLDLDALFGEVEESADLLDGSDDAPVIRLLNALIAEALRERASDIHIEPYEAQSRVRFRIDGVLKTVLTPRAQLTPLLISRIKIMSRLDISEKRLPQDGRMSVKLGGRAIDLRVSTLPSSYGERVVLRLLEKQAGHLALDDLGMPAQQRAQLTNLIQRPHGIILVTGPTGSGKTTTLYAALQEMDRRERNIMTVEDPVEYDLPGISQTSINLKTGLTFAKGLRAILRQDPDVILVGEIRDEETAEISTQASLTGHLVLSTLHTNTASGAVTRMQDIGIDSFLLSSTLRGVLAQRLVRRLCEECKTPFQPDQVTADELRLEAAAQIYTATGCAHCNATGYDGRLGIFELVIIDNQLQRLIHNEAGELEIEQAIRETVPSLRESGYDLVRRGLTTLEEILRVTSD